MFIAGKNKGFRIVSLMLKGHRIFKDLYIDFADMRV